MRDVKFIETKINEAKNAIMNTVSKSEPVPLRDFQVLYIQLVLAKCGGNKVHAAKSLGIDRRTIQRLIRSGRMRDCVHPASLPSTLPPAPPAGETKPYPLEEAG